MKLQKILTLVFCPWVGDFTGLGCNLSTGNFGRSPDESNAQASSGATYLGPMLCLGEYSEEINAVFLLLLTSTAADLTARFTHKALFSLQDLYTCCS